MLPDNAGGKAKVSGNDLVATVSFTNLPGSNSAFGAKTAKLKFGGSVVDSAPYEVFPAKAATNHPSDSTNRTWPNWMFYWMKTSANGVNTNVKYGGSSSGRSEYDYSGGRTIILMNDASASQIAAWGTPKGIDCFAWTTRHEAKHHTQITGFWPTTYVADDDRDVDVLPNDQEPTYMSGRPYDPDVKATYPDTFGYGQNPIPDIEDICMRKQSAPYPLDVLWSNESANDEDWASPGKNTKNRY